MTERTMQEKIYEIRSRLSALSSERVFIVAATKTQTVERINLAIAGGVDAVAENRVQEFVQKADLLPCEKHFIGRLQTNKVKYLIGNISLLHSCDRVSLLEEVNRLSLQTGTKTDLLLQVNVASEETKGGFSLAEIETAYQKAKDMQGVCVKGLMAMLPKSSDERYLRSLAKQMRKRYEEFAKTDENFTVLSMGMSEDYPLCVEEGSNMIRLGLALFGERK